MARIVAPLFPRISPVVRKLGEHLWRWELRHPEWTAEESADAGWEPVVASYAALAGTQLLLFDPLAPSEGEAAERFWAALDGATSGTTVRPRSC
jgi:hypothetical protein